MNFNHKDVASLARVVDLAEQAIGGNDPETWKVDRAHVQVVRRILLVMTDIIIEAM